MEANPMMGLGNGIRSALRAQPFRPFRIYLTDQREFEVRRPELAFVHPRDHWVMLTEDDGSYELLDMPRISNIRVEMPAAP